MPETRNGNGHPTSTMAPARRQEQPHKEQPQNAEGVNVSQVERYLSAGIGAVLALLGLTRRTPGGVVVAALGAGLVYRGVSGHCPLYQAMDVDTTGQRGEQKGVAPGHGVHVIHTVTINKPAAELYAFWRRLENLPRVMRHLEAVTQDGRRSHWVAKGPVGDVTWDAEITSEKDGEEIGWRSLAGAQVTNEGVVRFYPATGNRGTVLRVELRYDPPGGVLGSWLAWLFGEEPSLQVAEDLRRFKQWMETGEISNTDDQATRRF